MASLGRSDARPLCREDIGGVNEEVSEVEGFLTTLLEQRYENNNVTRTTCLRYNNVRQV